MDKRRITQIIATLVSNANINGFFNRNIYKGVTKKFCVPGLNCYSCPGALGSCPLGSLQAVIGGIKYNVSLYVLGIMSLFGVCFGRFICGWLCPFGLFQDLLHKTKIKKIKVNKKVDKTLRYLKHFLLLVFVILLPMLWTNDFGIGAPTFCEYICPAGTLEGGIPLVLLNHALRDTIGFLFAWKMAILIVVILLSLMIYRPFCKYLCPLGAFYGYFNKISFYKYKVKDSCNNCGACRAVCKMNVDVTANPNSSECIRCGECINVCKQNAIERKFK